MQSNEITIVIECNGREYGLIIPRTATVRQVKKEIEVVIRKDSYFCRLIWVFHYQLKCFLFNLLY